MSKPKPAVVPLHQIPIGPPAADCFALMVEKSGGTTQSGKPYYHCKFRDAKRTVGAMIWEDSDTYADCDAKWHVGGFYKIRCIFSVSDKYGPQIHVVNLRDVRDEDKTDGFDEGNFYERSRFDSEAMFEELTKLADTEIADVPLKALTLGVLAEHGDSLKRLPATQGKFFPFPGGWLEHTLSVTKNCLHLVDRYRLVYSELTPPLNRDIVVSAAILHDLGRVAEYNMSAVPGLPVELSVEGRLFGHLALGRDLIRLEASKHGELDRELLMLLEHVVLVHLALPEWGSPKLPAVPEALILHHADDLDAKLEMFVRNLMNDKSPSDLTEPDSVLKRALWKGRKA